MKSFKSTASKIMNPIEGFVDKSPDLIINKPRLGCPSPLPEGARNGWGSMHKRCNVNHVSEFEKQNSESPKTIRVI